MTVTAGASRWWPAPPGARAGRYLAAEIENLPVTAVGVTPGWLRSEMMLEKPPGAPAGLDLTLRCGALGQATSGPWALADASGPQRV